MPFDKETFSEIGRKFFVHGSISRAVSRANVPLFSRARLSMGISIQDYCLDEKTKAKHDAIGMWFVCYFSSADIQDT